jgi:outer membrane protein assembly factor BamE (lipoprotein component of BamABCDE complex)
MRILVLAAFTLTLAACASSGPTIDNAQLAELQKGKTTTDDILRRFGKPSFNSDNLDGTRTTAYLQEGTRSNAAAMVSMIGAVASGTGSTANVNSIIFRFDTKGVLSSYERTSESPTAMTASSGTSTAAPATAGSAPASASTTRAAPAKPAPRADSLPDWLPSRENRDGFNAAH